MPSALVEERIARRARVKRDAARMRAEKARKRALEEAVWAAVLSFDFEEIRELVDAVLEEVSGGA